MLKLSLSCSLDYKKIGEFKAYLRSEVDSRSCIHKKYRRVVNAVDGMCTSLCAARFVTGSVGAGLLASGTGFIPSLVLEAVTRVVGLLASGVTVTHRCSTKAAKHEAVLVLAPSKLNTVHTHLEGAGGLHNH